MRITFNMMARRTLDDVESSALRLAEAQRRVSTGKRISKPSDDVGATGLALHLRTSISGVEQYIENTAMVKSQLDVTSSTLDSIVNTIERVQGIAQQAVNGTMTSEARASLVAELDEIMTTLAGYGNTVYDGRYIFAGSATGTKPFAASATGSPPYDYAGNDTQVTIQVAPWTVTTSNVSGRTVFNMGSVAVSTSPDLFSTVQAVRNEIDAGNDQAVSGLLADVQANLTNVITIRSEVGARISRLEANSSSLEDSRVALATLLSKTEDADLAEAVLDMRTRENMYQAAIQTAARVLSISLADYLS